MISNDLQDNPENGLQQPQSESPSPEVAAPVVFQCCQCKSIVGDSSTISHLDPDQRTMSIKRKIEAIEVDPALHTSTREHDFGSTYHYFACACCKNIIGQVYRTTSAKLDHLRELFTYHSEQLNFYQLYPDTEVSSTQAEAVPTELQVSVEVTPVKTEKRNNGITGPTVENNPFSQTDLQVEVVKLQKFCLYLLDRVQALEEKQGKSRPSKSS